MTNSNLILNISLRDFVTTELFRVTKLILMLITSLYNSKIFNKDPKDDQIQQVVRWFLVYLQVYYMKSRLCFIRFLRCSKKYSHWLHIQHIGVIRVARNIHTGFHSGSILKYSTHRFHNICSSESQGIFTLGFTVEVFWNIQHISFIIFVHQNCKEYSHWKHCALPLGLVLVKLKLWIWRVLENINH